VDVSPDKAVQQAISSMPAHPFDFASVPRSEVDVSVQPGHGQSVTRTTHASNSIEPQTDLASMSAGELESAAAVTPDGPDREMQANSPRQDFAAAEPAAQLHDDHAAPDLAKRATIVGVWAPDAGTCSARNFRQGILPAVINTDGAWAGETFCVFKNKVQTESGWTVVAQCSNPRERWTANVRLTLDGNRLTWTSKRGTQAYTRCATDVLMAEAR
jgi:hypothetical protein